MIIRDAQADDVRAIADTWNQVIRDSTITFTSEEKTNVEIMKQIDTSEVFLVAEDTGRRVVGFCTMGEFRNGPGYVGTREVTLHLAAEARRKGAGRALMVKLETHARKLDIHVLISAISGTNTGALAFHRALGFDEVGRLPGVGLKFGRRLDLVLMQKSLCPPDTSL